MMPSAGGLPLQWLLQPGVADPKGPELRQKLMGLSFEAWLSAPLAMVPLYRSGFLGLGFAEIGSVSAKPAMGNAKPRCWRVPCDDVVINAMGLNNEGAEVIAEKLRQLKEQQAPTGETTSAGRTTGVDGGRPVGVNIAKTHDPQILGAAAVADFATSFRLLAPLADFVVLNVSCPNTTEGKTFEDGREEANAIGKGGVSGRQSQAVQGVLQSPVGWSRRLLFYGQVALCFLGPVGLPNFSVPTTPQSNTSTPQKLRGSNTPLSIERERSGHVTRKKCTDSGYFYKLSPSESVLLRKLSAACEKRRWPSVESLLSSYNGTGEPIFAAAINGALRCGKYQEGALIYDRCQRRFQISHTPVFSAALKIFGKCGEPGRVQEVWQDALTVGDGGLDSSLALARMSAAADEGDLNTSAMVLDLMIENNVSVDVIHLNSAIRCCYGQGRNQHRAAKYFFDLFPEYGIRPDIITFSSLMRAYTSAPLKQILAAYEEMKQLNIKPNKVFAEVYLVAVLHGLRMFGGPARIADTLREVAPERLKAAKMAVQDFEEGNVELTYLCGKMGQALDLLPI
eukprot:Skav209083  [mRNA]  locus=scaffold207:541580:550443:+ [translate_table: standard]